MLNWTLASTSWDDEEYNALNQQISLDQFSMGPKVKEMENKFAAWNDAKYTVMVNSGSSANLLMIAALFYTSSLTNRLQAGDEIIVPAVSWSTTYFPLQQYGLKVIFVDIDPETLNISISEVEKAITPRTRAIFAVNLLGNPCEFSKLLDVCNKHDLTLLEDNCESLGCCYNDQKGGTIGLMGSHSSYFSHHFSTMEGGYITTDDEELYHILLSLRSHGWTRHLPKDNLVSGVKSDNAFDEMFKFVLPGYNVRPLELSAAVGLKQIDKLSTFISERRKNGEHFNQVFSEISGLKIQRQIGKSSFFGFALTLDEQSAKNRFDLLKVLESLNVEYRPIVAGNFTKNSAIKYFDYEIRGGLENADAVDKRGFFLGNHHYDIKSKIDKLGKILKDYLQ